MNKAINFENMFSFSMENIFSFLQSTIDEELQKGEKEMDCALVDECVLLIEQLFGKEIYCPDEIQIDKKYKELEEKYETVKDDKAFWEDLEKDNEELKSVIDDKASEKTVKHIKFRKIFLVAALVALLSVLSAVVAGANEPFVSYCENLFGISFKDLFKHDTYTDGNITYINQNTDEVSTYSSVRDFVKGENIQGLYLPENLEIKEIVYSEFDGDRNIIFNPKNQNTYFSIDLSSKDKNGISYGLPSYTKTKTEKGIDVWVHKKDVYEPGTGSTQVMFKIYNWYYCISTSYPEEAIKLVDEFKEILP